ncbi:MAG: hypothetical protein WBY44_34880 [Bryobacteraceae bacterium]
MSRILSCIVLFTALAGAQSNDAGAYLMSLGSGTNMSPAAATMPMLMRGAGSWSLMFMGEAFIVDTQQSGPRGGDKLYSTNWAMGEASHDLWGGAFMFQLMLSLEPATVTNRSYPLLFQTGETAYGRPLIDAQHPHNLLMGAGFHYAHPLGEHAIGEIYYAPVGDPAIGPQAYPHRPSAAEIPQAPLGHHWQDSTHIAYNVATIAVKRDWLRLEASGFYGTEPGENRWTIGWGPMNSYSARVSVFPNRHWMAQASAGRLTRPERQSLGDVVRSTASLEYSGGGVNTSLIWGRDHDTLTQHNLNSYLAETVIPFRTRNFFTARWELVDKDELFASGNIYRIGEYLAGYTRDIATISGIETGIGANAALYTLPDSIKPFYGDHPWGVSLYLRLRLK